MALLLALCLAGCAVGRVQTERVILIGYAVGTAHVRACEVPMPAAVGPEPPVCVEIEGGAFSKNALEAISIAVSAVVAFFTSGLFF